MDILQIALGNAKIAGCGRLIYYITHLIYSLCSMYVSVQCTVYTVHYTLYSALHACRSGLFTVIFAAHSMMLVPCIGYQFPGHPGCGCVREVMGGHGG